MTLTSAQASSPILFVDVEPHLLQSKSRDLIECRPLHDFLREYPTVNLVVTSTSRLFMPAKEIAEHILTDALTRRLIGVTPCLSGVATPEPLRYSEILQWIAEHGHCGPFAVIDDNNSLVPEEWDRMIPMHPGRGITDVELQKSAFILGLEVANVFGGSDWRLPPVREANCS